MNSLAQQNSFQFYQSGDAEEVKRALLVLLDFVETQDVFDSGSGTVWNAIENIGYDIKNPLAKNPDLVLENKFISLLDSREIEQILVDLQRLLSSDFGVSADKATSSVVYSESVFQQDIVEMQFNNKTVGLLLGGYKKMTNEQMMRANEFTSDLTDRISYFAFQLHLLMSFLGYFNDLQYYSVPDIKKIFEGQMKEHDVGRLSHTLRDFMYYDDGREILEIFYNYLSLQAVYDKRDYKWEDAFFMTIVLHFVFKFFTRLDQVRQDFWLTNYFVRAVMADVPVRQLLEHELYYETNNLVDYIDYDLLYFTSLDSNKEELILQSVETKILTMNQIVKNYLSVAGDKINDSFRREQFIDELLSNASNKAFLKRIFREVLFIYCHLKSVNLVSKNKGSEPAEVDVFENQLERLLVWWLDEDFWNLIGDFFTNTDEKLPKLISLGRLLTEIKTNVNLGDQVTVDKLIRFSQFLKDRGVIGSEKDLIHFDEKTSKFAWNEDVLK